MRSMITIVFALVLLTAVICPSSADELTPRCGDVEAPHRHCWNPVEVANQEACHFFGHVSFYDHAPPMAWTGACRNGKAEGDGVLSDDMGNRAEGRLVAGLKEGRWTGTLASGSVITESHFEGVFHGPWTFDLSNGRFYSLHYEDGRMEGPWERRDDNGYSKTGTVEDGRFEGTFSVTWPNGVEAQVPYENGVIHGEMTVTRDGRPLGTLVYWKDRHVDGILRPELHFPDEP